MTNIPADVQAALDAYLAARVDDATWERYIGGLVPGRALDVAAMLCLGATPDGRAAHEIAFMYTPDEYDDGLVIEVPAYSSNLGLLVYEALPEGCDYFAFRRRGPREAYTYEAVVDGGEGESGWEGEGVVTHAEFLVYLRALDDAAYDTVRPLEGTVFAWALCRALCAAWAPEWARQVSAEVAR